MYKYIILILSFIFMSCGSSELSWQNFTPPSLKNQPRLLYPKSAQENSFTGKAKVIMVISETGIVKNAKIAESSGSDILDSAAVRYCRNLLFNPAIRNDKPVYSRMEMTVKFDLSGQAWNAKNYVTAVQDCYERIAQLNHFITENNRAEKNKVENEIFNWHNEFVKNMTDVVNFNFYVQQVIRPGLTAEWKNYWDTWPLSFLLYHDFIQRFQDYSNLQKVKAQLKNALREDIRYINETIVYSSEEQAGRKKLLGKIKKFIDDNYPSISFEVVDSI
jgi:TonB family protein